MNWPGLTREAREICEAIGLPDVCTVEVTKHHIKEAVFYDHYDKLKKEVASFEKLDSIKKDDFRTAQDYTKNNCLEHCRIAF